MIEWDLLAVLTATAAAFSVWYREFTEGLRQLETLARRLLGDKRKRYPPDDDEWELGPGMARRFCCITW